MFIVMTKTAPICCLWANFDIISIAFRSHIAASGKLSLLV